MAQYWHEDMLNLLVREPSLANSRVYLERIDSCLAIWKDQKMETSLARAKELQQYAEETEFQL